MNGVSARQLTRGVVLLAAVCAANACRYDQPITPGDLSAARKRGTLPDASIMSVDACVSPAHTTPINGASQYDSPDLADAEKLDATNAQFLISQSLEYAARYGGGNDICWTGGEILGTFPPSTPYNDPWMHDKYGMLPGHTHSGGNGMTIEKVTIFDYGDGISFDNTDNGTGTIDNWTIRNVHIKYGRDDCVENDAYFNGTIESSLLEGCNTSLSSREGDPPPPNIVPHPLNVITIRNSLFSLQSMDVIYSGSGDGNQVGPGHHGFWKWNLTNGPKVALYDNWFRVDGTYLGQTSSPQQDYLVLPMNKIAACQNNVIVWLGPPSTDPNYPEDLKNLPTKLANAGFDPGCIRIETEADGGLTHWNQQVAAWKTAHPSTIPNDVVPPIVSLFPPPQYWVPLPPTGPVTLVATAVDAGAISSVRFHLTGPGFDQDIGTVTEDGVSGNGVSGPTKYRLPWNSGSLNGTYTLTAIATDANNNFQTSAPVTVIFSNQPPPNQPPIASFTFTCTQLACTFTSTSTDPDGTVAGYAWTFGDGGTSTLQNPSHTYAANGTYTVRLTVTDNGGAASAPTSTPVTVPAPLAAPTNCVLRWFPAPTKILEVTWTNSGQPNVLTEVWYSYSAWTLDGTASPGANLWDKTPGQGQNGVWTARVRHVKTGSTPSAYCTTNGVYVSGL